MKSLLDYSFLEILEKLLVQQIEVVGSGQLDFADPYFDYICVSGKLKV